MVPSVESTQDFLCHNCQQPKHSKYKCPFLTKEERQELYYADNPSKRSSTVTKVQTLAFTEIGDNHNSNNDTDSLNEPDPNDDDDALQKEEDMYADNNMKAYHHLQICNPSHTDIEFVSDMEDGDADNDVTSTQ